MLDAGSTEITFDCQPFAYSVEEQQVSFVDVTETAILSVYLLSYSSPYLAKSYLLTNSQPKI